MNSLTHTGWILESGIVLWNVKPIHWNMQIKILCIKGLKTVQIKHFEDDLEILSFVEMFQKLKGISVIKAGASLAARIILKHWKVLKLHSLMNCK